MNPKTLNAIAWVAIVVIAVSLVNMGLQLTGNTLAPTATVNVTIQSTASINFTTDTLDFGTGAVDAGQTAVLQTNGSGSVTNGNWSTVTGQLVLVNTGNQNVSLNLSSDKAAAAYIGGSSPEFNVMVVEDEAGSCEGASASTFTALTTAQDEVCTNFPSDEAKDQLSLEIELKIPSDSKTGEQSAVITATGTTI